MERQITEVLWTYSICMYVVRFADGATRHYTVDQLWREFGERLAERINSLCHRLDGHWHRFNME